MERSKMKGIVIVAGTIIAFLLMKFLRIPYPVGGFFSGWTLAYAIIAVIAIVFGPIVGCAVGLLSSLIWYFSLGFTIHRIVMALLYGLYGFIIGNLSENKSSEPRFNNSSGNVGRFALSGAVVYFVVRIFSLIAQIVIVRGNVDIGSSIKSNIIGGLIVGGIAFALAYICHKFLKINIPQVHIQLPQRHAATTGENTITGELMKCSACGKEYHYKAHACPNCGKRNPRDAKAQIRYFIIVGILLVIVAIASLLFFGSYISGVNSRLDDDLENSANKLREYGVDPGTLEPGW